VLDQFMRVSEEFSKIQGSLTTFMTILLTTKLNLQEDVTDLEGIMPFINKLFSEYLPRAPVIDYDGHETEIDMTEAVPLEQDARHYNPPGSIGLDVVLFSKYLATSKSDKNKLSFSSKVRTDIIHEVINDVRRQRASVQREKERSTELLETLSSRRNSRRAPLPTIVESPDPSAPVPDVVPGQPDNAPLSTSEMLVDEHAPTVPAPLPAPIVPTVPVPTVPVPTVPVPTVPVPTVPVPTVPAPSTNEPVQTEPVQTQAMDEDIPSSRRENRTRPTKRVEEVTAPVPPPVEKTPDGMKDTGGKKTRRKRRKVKRTRKN